MIDAAGCSAFFLPRKKQTWKYCDMYLTMTTASIGQYAATFGRSTGWFELATILPSNTRIVSQRK